MTLPLLVSLVGLTACALVISINLLTITRTNRQTIKKRIELILIFSRCFLDIFVGLTVTIYIAVIVLKTLDFNRVTTTTTYFVVFSSLPSVFFWPARFVLTVCISLWRILVHPRVGALYSYQLQCLILPQLGKPSHSKLICCAVLILSALFGLTDVLVLLLACPLQFVPHPGCMSLGCMTGSCFVTYSTHNRSVLFSVTFLCAIVYAILICFCETNECREKRIVETDYWFLLCLFITTVFDCIPFAVTTFGAVDSGYKKFGPLINTLNMVGACFDAVVVSKIFETHQFF